MSKIYVNVDEIKNFINLFKEMVEPTKKENGYIQYEMYQDNNDPTIFIVLEQWESESDFNNHLSSDHFNKIVPKMSKLMVKETELNIASRVV